MGCDPSPDFDTHYYLKANRDVRLAKINPLVHYLRWGRAEDHSLRPGVVNLYPNYPAWWTQSNQPRFALFLATCENAPEHLQGLLASMWQQWYPHVQVHQLSANEEPAARVNAILARQAADWIGFLDPSEQLPLQALFNSKSLLAAIWSEPGQVTRYGSPNRI